MTKPYGSHAPKIVILAEAQNWRCCYCHRPMEPWSGGGNPQTNTATVEHYVAKAAGGVAEWHNEVAACMACNTRKGCHSPILFWLLMQAYGNDRRAVHRAMRVNKAQRAKLKTRLHRIYALHGTEGLRLHAMLPGQCQDIAPILPQCDQRSSTNDQGDRPTDFRSLDQG